MKKNILLFLALFSLTMANEKNWFTSANIWTHLPAAVVTNNYGYNVLLTGTLGVTGITSLGQMTSTMATINGVNIGQSSGAINASGQITAGSLTVNGVISANNLVSKFQGYNFNFESLSDGQSIIYDGTNFINKKIAASGAGVGIYYYLDDSKSSVFTTWNQSLVTPNTSTAEDIDTVTVNSGTSPLLYGYYVTKPLGITSIPAGEWLLNLYDYVDSSTGVSTISINFYTVTPLGVKTKLFNMVTLEINHTVVELQTIRSIQPEVTLLATDSILMEVWAETTSVGNRQIKFTHNGKSHYSNFRLPMAADHNLLTGLQGGAVTTYYHSNQAINNNSSVTFGNISTGGTITGNVIIPTQYMDFPKIATPSIVEGRMFRSSNDGRLRYSPDGASWIDMGIFY